MPEDKIKVEAPGARATFERWLRAGDKVGVFSNHDLGSADVGRRVFIRLDPDYVAKAPIGTRAPDSTSYGLGRHYLLDEVVADLSRFKFAP